MLTGIDLIGVPEVHKALSNLEDGVAEMVKAPVGVGSALPYAYGIEYGRHRSGKLARRAGPAKYMQGAIQKEIPGITKRLAKAIEGGASDVRDEKQKIAEDMTKAAQDIVPVVTGALRSSLTPIYPGGPTPQGFTQRTTRGYRGTARTTISTRGRGSIGRLH